MADPWKIFAERKLVLISVRDSATSTQNIMPARWCTRCSSDPPLIAVSIGLNRYTHQLLERNSYFGIAVPNNSFDPTLIGSTSGRERNKFLEGKIDFRLSRYDIPLIRDAQLNIELEKIDKFQTGDHSFFIGRVLNFVYPSTLS